MPAKTLQQGTKSMALIQSSDSCRDTVLLFALRHNDCPSAIILTTSKISDVQPVISGLHSANGHFTQSGSLLYPCESQNDSRLSAHI